MVRWGLIGAGDIVRKRVAAALRDAPGSTLAAVSRARADLAEAFAKTSGADALACAVGRSRPRPGNRRRLRRHAGAPARRAGHRRGRSRQARPLREADGDGRRRVRSHDCRMPRPITSRLGVAYYRHFYPVVARVRAILAAGEIGDPVLAQIDAFERFNPQPHEERHWFVKRCACPAAARCSTSAATGSSCCFRCSVRSGRPWGSRPTSIFDREVEDTAVAALRFASGPCATVTVTHAAIEPRDTLRIFGTSGSIHIAVLNAGETGRHAGRPGAAARRTRRRRTFISRSSRTSSTRCIRIVRLPSTGQLAGPSPRSKRGSIGHGGGGANGEASTTEPAELAETTSDFELLTSDFKLQTISPNAAAINTRPPSISVMG